jgi:hypothetical protein
MSHSKVIKILMIGVFGLVGIDAIASNPTITTGEQDARFQTVDTTFTADAAPVLHERLVGQTASLVEGADIEDLFPYNTQVTQVLVTIEPPSGHDMAVTAVSGPSWTENAVGAWEATFSMPAPGGTTTGEFHIVVDPGGTEKTNGGVFKIKKAGT